MTERDKKLILIKEVALKAASILDMDKLLSTVVELIQSNFYYSRVGISLITPGDPYLRLKRAIDEKGDFIKPIPSDLKLEENSINTWVARTGKPLLVNDVSKDSRYLLSETWKDTRSELAVPLKIGNEVLGVLDIQSIKPNAFEEEDISLLEDLARQLSIIIHNNQLWEREKNYKRLYLNLQQVTRSITACLDLDRLLKLISEKAAEFFNVPATSIMLWDERKENLIVKESYGLSEEYVKRQRIPIKSISKYLSQEDFRPIYTEDLRSTPYGKLRLIKKEGLCSCLSFPLLYSSKPLGLLNIYSKETPKRFLPEEVEIGKLYADQATIAIVNAKTHNDLQRLEQWKSWFMGSIGHDLRNALTVIGASLKTDPSGIIREELKHLDKMAEELLELSKIEERKPKLQKAPVDIASLLSQSAEHLKDIAQEKNISILEDFSTPLPSLTLDKEKIKRVFDNLISNAIKYTEEGREIRLQARKEEENVVILIRNPGVIHRKDLPYIFEKFYKGEKSKGVGLGLTIAKRFVEFHKGRIGVECKGGEVIFRVELPIGDGV